MIAALLVGFALVNLYAAHRNIRTARRLGVVSKALKRAYDDLARERVLLRRASAQVTAAATQHAPFN